LEESLRRIIETLPQDKLEGTKNIHIKPYVFLVPLIKLTL